MGDGEAFELFLKDEMPNICRVENFNVAFRGRSHRLEHILYKWLRCGLAHEASLPTDIHFSSAPPPPAMSIGIASDGTLTLSHGWFFALAGVVVAVPENSDLFGLPPKPPLPISIPRIGLTITELVSATMKEKK